MNFYQIIIFIIISTTCKAQNFQRISLPQKTNSFLYFSDYKLFISSLEGGYIFDGFKPKPLLNRFQTFDKNIQSPFFEDQEYTIWFSTYTALNYYNQKTDSLRAIRLKNYLGESITSDYYIIGFVNDNLYIKASDIVYDFNPYEKKIIRKFNIDLTKFNKIICQTFLDSTYLIATTYEELLKVTIHKNEITNIQTKNIQIGTNDLENCFDEKVLFSNGSKSIYTYNFLDYETEIKFTFPNNVISIDKLSGEEYLINTKNVIYKFDIYKRKILDSFNIHIPYLNTQSIQIISSHMSEDSLLFISSDTEGIYYTDLKKIKFKQILNNINWSTKNIFHLKDNLFIICSAYHGIVLLNSQGIIIQKWEDDIFLNNPLIAAILINQNQIFFSSLGKFFLLDIKSGKTFELSEKTSISPEFLYQFELNSNDDIISTALDKGLVKIYINSDEKTFTLEKISNSNIYPKAYTYFKISYNDHLIASYNEECIHYYKLNKDSTYTFIKTLPIEGGISSYIKLLEKDTFHYITNSQGIFKIKDDYSIFYKITDSKKFLHNHIYSILPDNNGYWWLSTNEGIWRYDTAANEVHKFTLADGVQEMEFNSHAYLVDDKGRFWLGGVNGVNVFHPDSIKLSQKQAPIDIYQYKINDVESREFGPPSYIQEITLPYDQNTISFEFVAIDYGDPEATRTKYKLSGVDKNWVTSETTEGFARYANLDPGDYTFSILGTNSDKVWGKEERKVNISILPPFWMTWWFRTLIVLAIGSIVYIILKNYYDRKMERKNFLLRQQSLIIEKQRAVENERSRIASEMHDDLGSGLTTIQYLSEKALRNTRSKEEEEKIQKISLYSKQLVTNMSEIIWAMNNRFDNTHDLYAYIRRYAKEFLDERKINIYFQVNKQIEELSISGEKRRNLFLVIKELLHNSAKYSQASGLSISINQEYDSLQINVVEKDGIGFDRSSIMEGNGLLSIEKRMTNIEGNIQYTQTESGMHYLLQCPLNNIMQNE